MASSKKQKQNYHESICFHERCREAPWGTSTKRSQYCDSNCQKFMLNYISYDRPCAKIALWNGSWTIQDKGDRTTAIQNTTFILGVTFSTCLSSVPQCLIATLRINQTTLFFKLGQREMKKHTHKLFPTDLYLGPLYKANVSRAV